MKYALAFVFAFAVTGHAAADDDVHDLFAKTDGKIVFECSGPRWKSSVDRGHLGPMQLNGYLVNSIEIDCGYDGVVCHPTECFYYGTISKSQFFAAPVVPPGVHVLGSPK